MEKITLCGDDCLQCPRYLAESRSELEKWRSCGSELVGEIRFFLRRKLSALDAPLINSVPIILWNAQKRITSKSAGNVHSFHVIK